LKGNISYYYGSKNIQLEGTKDLTTYWQKKISNLKKKIFYGTLKATDTALVNSLKKNKIDVVLAEYGTHAHSILPLIKKARVPMVVHFHGYDASMPEVIEKCKNYKAIFQYAVKVIAVSKKMEQMLLELGCPREKLVYNVYGPQPEFLEVIPQYSQKQFIAIGRFTDKKAPYYTILAFRKAVEKHPEAKLIMAGDGQLLNTCKNLVAYFGLENRVDFPGVISPETYRNILSQSLGLVQHSITSERGDMEGTPLSILEASAAGLPVIATYHAGIMDVIQHGTTGLLCEEHDVDTMTENLVSLLDNKEFAKTLGTAGKNNMKSNYTLERHIQSLQNTLENAIQHV
jgi:glycosyltransferase involved in cell wall biosynthesis